MSGRHKRERAAERDEQERRERVAMWARTGPPVGSMMMAPVGTPPAAECEDPWAAGWRDVGFTTEGPTFSTFIPDNSLIGRINRHLESD